MLNDIRYGVRNLVKHPGFTIIVVIVLALGIGANTAIFSVVNGVLLRPLSYRDSDQLMMIWGNFLKLNIERLTAKSAEYEDYRAQGQIFEQVAAFENLSLSLTGEEQAERITGARVTANLFSMLGAQVEQGRGFLSDENQTSHKLVVVSHGFWRRRFSGKASAVGQTLRLDDQDYTVIGVMPEDFQFPHARFSFAEPADLWIPLVYSREQVAQRQGPYYLHVISRLKSDVTLSQARAEMNALGQRFESEHRGYRGPNGADGGWRITLSPLQEEAAGSSRRALLLLFGAVALVLLIACANVANLLLVRAAIRQKELALRLALGASRWRITRQLLVESLILAVLGGVSGLLIALWGVDSLAALQAANLPPMQEISVDWRVLVFTALLTILTALIFGLIPAWQASNFNLQRTLKENKGAAIGGWRRHYWRNGLLIGEVALSLVVLIGAGLLVNSFLRLQHIQPAIATDKLLTVEINLSDSRYRERAQISGFFQELVRRVEALPGVEAASLSTARPLSGVARNDPFSVEGRALALNNPSFAGWQMVGANYFQTLGIPLVQGRDLTFQDMEEAAPAVAVINETMAHRYWPNENPIGRRITVGLPRADNPWATIIGIAKDLPHRAIDSLPEPGWYLSRPPGPQHNQILFVRTAVNPSQLAAPVRDVIAEIDRDQPVTNIKTMSDVVADTVAPRKFNMLLFGLFAVIAMLLAALGIYGVTAYSVAERTQEIGIRMALGAQKSDVLGLVISNGVMLTLIGVAVGLALALALTHLMTTLLFGITPNDATTFALVSAFLILMALLACYIPARRATKVDPLVALRYE
ncbi:MAG TPA: ABC transporter permease, partial [Pyrinomonadaceae bacterium]|nr:ABC transporter permease [Pyrinomonadaceae bacterium]